MSTKTKPKREWKDIHGQGGIHRSTFKVHLGTIVVRLQGVIAAGGVSTSAWFLDASFTGLEKYPLKAKDVEAAKREALTVLTTHADEINRAIVNCSLVTF